MAESVETAVYRLRVEGQDQIDRATRSVEGLATAEDKLASSNRTTSAQIQRGIAQYDPLIRQQEKYLAAMKQIENARERGTASESQLTTRLELEKKALNDVTVAAEHLRRAQANAQITPFKSAEQSALAFEAAASGASGTIPTATKHMEQLGNSTKGARYEMINLGRQAQDVVVSLGSGQNILMVGLQQGSQILDVFLSSERSAAEIFKDFGSLIGRFLLNPLTIAVGTVGALAAAVLSLANAWDKAQVASQRALSGAGARSGTTVTDINAFVERSSGVSGTRQSGAEARELGNAFAATGKIVVSELDDMSDAVIGFANKTGKSTKEVRDLMVQFATDPIKGMEELEKVWGDLDAATRNAVKAQVDARDNTAAWNILLRATAEESAKAAKNMTVLEKATRLLFSSREIGPKPTGIEDQVEAARKRVETAMGIQAPVGPDQAAFAERNAEAVRDLEKAYEELFAAQQKLINQGMTLRMNELSKAVGVVEQSIIPQIAQIEKLTTAIEAMEIAKAKGVVGPFGAQVDANALTIAKGMQQDLIESQDAAARVTEEVNRIAAAHQGVSRAVAVELDGLEKQTALAGAVGGAEKMAAQYAIDYADAKKRGATNTEAGLIASEKQAATQAAINAAAAETLFNLQNQYAVSAAVTGEEKIKAQHQATFNKLLHDGVSESLAMAVAAQEEANARAAATANVLRQVKALEQSTEMIKAQTADLGTGANNAEMMAAAGIAYKNAIESGASATAAAALSSETIANYMAKAAYSAQQLEQTRIDAFMKDQSAISRGEIPADAYATMGGGPLIGGGATLTLGGGAQVSYRGGGGGKNLGLGPVNIEAAWKANQEAMADFAASFTPEAQIKAFELSLAKAQASRDVGGQIVALRGELGYLQTQPQTTENYQKIASLQDAIDNLTKSTDALSGSTDSLNATNRELLSPYYTQDPRTSHIGFRSQGMALGGYVDVPGSPSSNDNMIATVPVASGERIYIDPMNNRRSISSGSGTVINISSPITINGNANADQFGRTLFQANQQLAKQVRAATQ